MKLLKIKYTIIYIQKHNRNDKATFTFIGNLELSFTSSPLLYKYIRVNRIGNIFNGNDKITFAPSKQ